MPAPRHDARRPDDRRPGQRRARVVEVARDLQRFLAEDLTLHIAKEEELFPALRSLADGIDDTIVHIVAQHDEIRAWQELIDRTTAALDAHHHIEDERDAFISVVGAMAAVLTPAVLEDLRERSMCIEWILLEHFAEAEEDLFVPANVLLAPEVLEERAAQMAAMDRTGPPT